MMKLIIVVFALACVLLCAPNVWAEDKCQSFQAISQMKLDLAKNAYMGPMYALLENEVLIDDGTSNPPPQPKEATRKCQGSVCQDRKMHFLFNFGAEGGFITEIEIAVYDKPPFEPTDPPMMGTYRTQHKIISGTGRLEKASGNFTESGPFMAWSDSMGPQSRYTGFYVGKICGVTPKT